MNQERPGKKGKTYAEDFFERFPHYPLQINRLLKDGSTVKHPAICRRIYGATDCKPGRNSEFGGCVACWQEKLEGEARIARWLTKLLRPTKAQ